MLNEPGNYSLPIQIMTTHWHLGNLLKMNHIEWPTVWVRIMFAYFKNGILASLKNDQSTCPSGGPRDSVFNHIYNHIHSLLLAQKKIIKAAMGWNSDYMSFAWSQCIWKSQLDQPYVSHDVKLEPTGLGEGCRSVTPGGEQHETQTSLL